MFTSEVDPLAYTWKRTTIIYITIIVKNSEFPNYIGIKSYLVEVALLNLELKSETKILTIHATKLTL